MYDAVVRAKLVYGLESIYLTHANEAKLNIFQKKGLRKILGLQPVVSNGNPPWYFSDKLLFDTANKQCGVTEDSPNQRILLISQYLRMQRLKLLEQVLTAEKNDPIRAVTADEKLELRDYSKFRQGRPTGGAKVKNWWQTSLIEYWDYVVTPKAKYYKESLLDYPKRKGTNRWC